MRYTLYSAAATDPVTLAEAKLHLRVTHEDEDSLITGLITAATDFAQAWTGRQFVSATYDLYLDKFPTAGDWYYDPDGWGWKRGEIIVPKPPLASVTSVKYYDLDGVLQTLAAATYEVDTSCDPGRIRLAYNQSWPTVRSQSNAIVIRFVCGYGAYTAVPESIKTAIKLHVGHLYENREAVNIGNIVTPVNFAMESLLNLNKVPANI